MSTITIGLIMFVALEFLFIMYLETFATTSKENATGFQFIKRRIRTPFTEYIVQKSRNL